MRPDDAKEHNFDGDAPFARSHSAVLPIVLWNGAEMLPWGTCFAITPGGAAITALHVIDRFVRDFAEQTFQGTAGAFAVYEAMHPLNDAGSRIAFLPVVSYDHPPTGDVCLIKFALPPGVQLPTVPLNVGLPEPGASCSAVGYSQMYSMGAVHAAGKEPALLEFDRRVSESRGVVEEIFRHRRDDVRMPWPSFSMNARLDGGMSGGPILDSNGRAFGVACSSFPALTEDQAHVSFGSLLGPSLGLRVPRAAVGDEATTIAVLWDAGVIDIIGEDDVDLERTEHEGTVVYKDD